MSTPEFVDVAIETAATRHLAKPETLRTQGVFPGRKGAALCGVVGLDQKALDHWRIRARGGSRSNLARSRGRVRIADLPLCRRCARSAPVSQEGGKP